jgi:hypothetical protein
LALKACISVYFSGNAATSTRNTSYRPTLAIEPMVRVAVESCDGFLQCLQLADKCGVGRQHGAQSNEGAHDIDAHLHSARTVENGGGHDNAVFGESQRQVFSMTTMRQS